MKKKILICDDELDILRLFRMILSDEYEVVAVDSIRDIETLVHNHVPDLIIMDLRIPVIGGENAAFRLKENPHYHDIPIILFSANDELPLIADKVHANDFLKKPVVIKDLRKKISEYMAA